MKEIQTTIGKMAGDLVAFRDGYETRLKKLENLEVMLKRPGFEQGEKIMSAEETTYKTAFSNYIRKGDEQGLHNSVTKSLSAGSDENGGYLIPQIIEEKITEHIEESSPLRRIASVLTVSGSAVEMLVDSNGLADAGWSAETSERTETNAPKLSKIRIPVHELYARPRATQKLLDDSMVDLENWLASRIATRMTQLENTAFITGDGKNKPRGILSYETCAANEWAWGKFEHIKTGAKGDFDEKNGADILISTVNALKTRYLKGAVWLMSRSAHAAIRKLKDANGHYLWQPGFGSDCAPTLLGYPVEVTEEMPELISGTASKSIIFGNFREAYQIVDRAGSNVLRDPYSAKPYVEFYTVKRVGGDVINFEALKIINFDEA